MTEVIVHVRLYDKSFTAVLIHVHVAESFVGSQGRHHPSHKSSIISLSICTMYCTSSADRLRAKLTA